MRWALTWPRAALSALLLVAIVGTGVISVLFENNLRLGTDKHRSVLVLDEPAHARAHAMASPPPPPPSPCPPAPCAFAGMPLGLVDADDVLAFDGVGPYFGHRSASPSYIGLEPKYVALLRDPSSGLVTRVLLKMETRALPLAATEPASAGALSELVVRCIDTALGLELTVPTSLVSLPSNLPAMRGLAPFARGARATRAARVVFAASRLDPSLEPLVLAPLFLSRTAARRNVQYPTELPAEGRVMPEPAVARAYARLLVLDYLADNRDGKRLFGEHTLVPPNGTDSEIVSVDHTSALSFRTSPERDPAGATLRLLCTLFTSQWAPLVGAPLAGRMAADAGWLAQRVLELVEPAARAISHADTATPLDAAALFSLAQQRGLTARVAALVATVGECL